MAPCVRAWHYCLRRRLVRFGIGGAGFRPCSVSTNVLNAGFQGIGFGITEHLENVEQHVIDGLYARVWRDIAPEHALVAHAWDWNWDTVVPFLKQVCRGSDIWL